MPCGNTFVHFIFLMSVMRFANAVMQKCGGGKKFSKNDLCKMQLFSLLCPAFRSETQKVLWFFALQACRFLKFFILLKL